MTISKAKFEELALEVAQFSKATDKEITDFALTLIRRVEAESITVDVHNNQVVYVPLVSEGRP